jgi:hypothetical protein
MFSLPPEAKVSIWNVDASYVVANMAKVAKGKQQFRDSPFFSVHGHIWEALGDLHVKGMLPLPTKIKSHQSIPEAYNSHTEFRDFALNGISDVLADLGAEFNQLPDLHLMLIEEHTSLSFMITMRIACIEADLALWRQNNKVTRFLPCVVQAVSEQQVGIAVQERLLTTGHRLRRTKQGLKCLDCGETTRFNTTGFEFWLTITCMEPDPFQPLSEDSLLTAEPKEKVVDFAQAIQVRAQAIQRANLQLRRSTKRLLAQVTKKLFSAIPFEKTLANEVNQFQDLASVPQWFFATANSHDMWTAGGALWCRRCGSVATEARQHKLLGPCNRSCPPGSRSRVNRLNKGKPVLGWDSWPNGLPFSSRLKVFPFLRINPAPQSDEESCPEAESDVPSEASPSLYFEPTPLSYCPEDSSSEIEVDPADVPTEPYFWLSAPGAPRGIKRPLSPPPSPGSSRGFFGCFLEASKRNKEHRQGSSMPPSSSSGGASSSSQL